MAQWETIPNRGAEEDPGSVWSLHHHLSLHPTYPPHVEAAFTPVSGRADHPSTHPADLFPTSYDKLYVGLRFSYGSVLL